MGKMTVQFKAPFYSTEKGLIPRKRDALNKVVEIDDDLVSVLPIDGLKIIKADPKIIEEYKKRQDTKRRLNKEKISKREQAEANKQTDNLIRLLTQLQQGLAPVAAAAAAVTQKNPHIEEPADDDDEAEAPVEEAPVQRKVRRRKRTAA